MLLTAQSADSDVTSILDWDRSEWAREERIHLMPSPSSQ